MATLKIEKTSWMVNEQPVSCSISGNIPLPVNCVEIIILAKTRNFLNLEVEG